ncbi:MAG: hypothetical protein ACJ8C4_03715 [Gemmataceae bacterium]
MEIKWTDTDPATGEKRYIFAERFGGFWKFRARTHRRGDSKRISATREIWEVVLDNLERRYQRREGVSDLDVQQVRDIIRELKDTPTPGDE